MEKPTSLAKITQDNTSSMHSITSRWDLQKKSSDEGLHLGNRYARDVFASGLKHLFYWIAFQIC